MHLSLVPRCLASLISQMLLCLVLATLLGPFLPSFGLAVSALRFRDTSFSLPNLQFTWPGLLSHPDASLGPDPAAKFSQDEEPVTAPQPPNQVMDDHRRPLEHDRPLLPRLQPRRPPSRRATATLPDTWIIQRIYEGQSFFKCVLCSFYPQFHW